MRILVTGLVAVVLVTLVGTACVTGTTDADTGTLADSPLSDLADGAPSDVVTVPDVVPDLVTVPDVVPDLVTVPDVVPDLVTVPDAVPDLVTVPDGVPDLVTAPDTGQPEPCAAACLAHADSCTGEMTLFEETVCALACNDPGLNGDILQCLDGAVKCQLEWPCKLELTVNDCTKGCKAAATECGGSSADCESSCPNASELEWLEFLTCLDSIDVQSCAPVEACINALPPPDE